MKGAPFLGLLRWKDLLPVDKRLRWFSEKRKPDELDVIPGNSLPGVYRFRFPEQVDGSAKHTPCYIGEAGDIGERLQRYFRSRRTVERRDECGELILGDAWRVIGVIGAIENSKGDFSLEVLELKAPIKIAGVMVNSFEDPFARRFLENLALLHAVQVENLRPLNSGVSQGSKDFRRKAKAAGSRRSESLEE
jgi:hypothetical protein